jgi:hypothetical protein
MRTNCPDGTKILELTPQKIEEIWQKLQQIKGLFDDFATGRIDVFLRGLLNPATIWLELSDGNGIIYATDVVAGLSAQVHFVYWDRKLAPRRQFTLKCLQWLVNVADLQKVNAIIPSFCTAAIHFAKKLGFTVEGVIRRYSLNGGRLYDAVHLGMIREEVLDGSRLQMDGRPTEPRGDEPISNDVRRPTEECLKLLSPDPIT